MRRKTDPVEKTQEELIEMMASEKYEEIDQIPELMFDPAEAEDYEHLEELEGSHGYRCIEHRLREKIVYANYGALKVTREDLSGRQQAFYTGVFHGLRDALGTRKELMAEAQGEQLEPQGLPSLDPVPPKRGQKALLFPKPTKKRARARKKA